MAQDPRNFTVDRACLPAKDILSASNKKDAFSLLGKVGDLEVLNNGGSDIGKGLRTLGSISDSVRNRSGIVPDVFRTVTGAVDAGADTVLNTVGFNPRQVRDTVSRLNPGVANRAVGQAEAIYDSVRNGRFDEFDDIPGAIQDFTNLEGLVRGIFTGETRREDRFKDQCVSPYAMDLVSRAPKHKFMYVVEIVLNEPYVSAFNAIQENIAEELAFVTKRAARPNISFDYEEVNYYNFRSKVLKRHEYQPIAMSFYDDHNGKAITFWNNYLRAVSPQAEFGPAGSGTSTSLLEASGMNFEPGADLSGSAQSSSGTSSLLSDANGVTPTTVINHINLYHFYKSGTTYDIYTFINPKITELQLDELDMTQTGDGTEVAITFSYDALYMETALETDQETSNDMAALTDAGAFEFRPPVQQAGSSATSGTPTPDVPVSSNPLNPLPDVGFEIQIPRPDFG